MNKERIYRNIKLAFACLEENEKEFREGETSPELLGRYHEAYRKLYELCALLHKEWEIEE